MSQPYLLINDLGQLMEVEALRLFSMTSVACFTMILAFRNVI